jgi:hypothetical protein
MVGLPHRADFAAEQVVDLVQGAIEPPLVEVPPDGAPGREVDGEVPLLAAGAEDVQDGVDDVPRVGHAGSPAGVDWDVQLDQGPLRVGDVAGVMVRSQTPFYAPRLSYGTDSQPYSGSRLSCTQTGMSKPTENVLGSDLS